MVNIFKLGGIYFLLLMIIISLIAIFHDGKENKQDKTVGITILSISIIFFIIGNLI